MNVFKRRAITFIATISVLTVTIFAGKAFRESSADGSDGGGAASTEAGDVNGDALVNIGDAIYLLSYLFQGGDAPVACAAGGLEEVTGNDIVDGTVTGRDIRDGSLTEIDLFLRNLSVVNGRRKANVSIGAPRSNADHGLVQVFDENVDAKVTVGLADKGAGVIETFGPSGNTNCLDSTTTDEEKGPQARATTLLSTSSNPDNGFITVGNPEDDQLAGMYASGSGEGVIFADQKNFVIDHPDREDHLLVQSCMEGPEVGVYYR